MPGGSSADTSITSSRTCSRASRALKICKTCTLTRRGARSRMRCATSRRSRGSLPASSRSSHRRTRRSQSTSSKSPAPTSARPDRERTMLTQAINTTRQIASSIAALPVSSAGIKIVQAHAARSRMRCATSRRSRGSLPASSRSSHRRTRRSQSTSSKSPAPTSARPDRERTMLTQAINTTRQIASSIAALPASSAGIKTVQAHVATFVTGTLPSVVEVQQATLALARDALSRIEPLLAPGTLAQALIDTLAALRKEATALQAVVTGTATSVANAVDQLSADAGTLTNEAIQINAQVASLNAQRDANKRKADEIATRIKWINAFSWIPIVKLADELASLISDQKTTEQLLSDAENNLQRAEQQQAVLTAVMQQTRSISTSVGQLANATQSLANAVNLVAGELGEGQATTSEQLAQLFATALKNNLTALQSLAS